MEPVVHVVDDDPHLLKSVRWLLESVGLNVATFESAKEFLLQFNEVRRGCVLLDVRMPEMSGLELQEDLRKRSITIPIIVFTGHGDVAMAVQCMKAGAFDFIEKPHNEQRLIDRIHDAIEHDKELRAKHEVGEEARALIARLTPREGEVLELIVQGLANKQTAARLGISEKTVEVHRSRVMGKLKAKGVADAIKIALRARPE